MCEIMQTLKGPETLQPLQLFKDPVIPPARSTLCKSSGLRDYNPTAKERESYLVFGDAQLKLSALFLDVVVLDLHLVCELQPLLEGLGHRALQLHLLLRSPQSLAHLHGRGGAGHDKSDMSVKNVARETVDQAH